MHTTDIGHDWKAVHNGDFSGEVQLINPNGITAGIVAFWVMEAIVAQKVRMERFRTLENMSDMGLLYGT